MLMYVFKFLGLGWHYVGFRIYGNKELGVIYVLVNCNYCTYAIRFLVLGLKEQLPEKKVHKFNQRVRRNS